jgi:hypothetical protein
MLSGLSLHPTLITSGQCPYMNFMLQINREFRESTILKTG